jgi:hypothetical protein
MAGMSSELHTPLSVRAANNSQILRSIRTIRSRAVHTCIDAIAADGGALSRKICVVEIVLGEVLAGGTKIEHGEVQGKLSDGIRLSEI